MMSLLDLRHVIRGLRRSPVFTMVTLATLALAIGANAAVFSLIDQALLRPLPYPEPDRLVAVWADWSKRGALRNDFTNPADFADWREQSTTIEDMAAYTESRPALTGFGVPRQLLGATVSHSFFDVLATRMQSGRGFAPEEDVPNGPDVAVISHELWQRELDGKADIAGQTLNLNGEPFTIIGVLPPDFVFPFMPGREVWTLLQTERDGRGDAWLRVVGRLAQGVDIRNAAGEMTAIADGISQRFPEENGGIGVFVQPLRDAIVDDVRLRLLVLWAAVGFVLLVACVNIANLLLVRSAARARELAIRGALGAGRRSLVRLVVAESLLLSLGGTLLGLLLGSLAVRTLHGQLPGSTAEYVSAAIDVRVAVVATLAGLITGLAFGLLPAFRAGGADPAETLQRGDRSGHMAPVSRARNTLVVANFALALALTVGAGLFAKSLLRLEAVDTGFRPAGVLTATLTLPEASYEDSDSLRAFHRVLRERLSAVPGVTEAGLTHSLPLADFNTDTTLVVEGRPTDRRDGRAHVWYSIVSPGYLDAMRIEALRGRVFDERQPESNSVVVNEAFVREYLNGADPLGVRVTAGNAGEGKWLTIIGVVDDVRFFGVDRRQTPAAYLPLDRYPARRVFITLRGAGDPNLLSGPLREAVASLDPEIALDDVIPMTALVDVSLKPARSTATLVATFAGAALLIAVIGVYGAIAYSASRRRREFGVRMAVGASGADVLRLVLRQGLMLASGGVLAGLMMTVALSRAYAALLYDVHPLDPMVFAGVSGLLLMVALAATVVPAVRAARTQPMRVLREE